MLILLLEVFRLFQETAIAAAAITIVAAAAAPTTYMGTRSAGGVGGVGRTVTI